MQTRYLGRKFRDPEVGRDTLGLEEQHGSTFQSTELDTQARLVRTRAVAVAGTQPREHALREAQLGTHSF